MSVESFRKRLEAGRSIQHRDQLYRAWSLVTGLVAVVVCVVLSGSLADMSPGEAAGQWLYLTWMLGAWLGAIALLVYGATSRSGVLVRGVVASGLWAGNLAMAAGVVMAPLALVLLLLPLGVGAMLIRRAHGRLAAAIYACVPLLALAGGVILAHRS